MAEVIQQAGPGFLRFTHHDGLRVTCHFIRAKARMKTTHDDRDAPFTVAAADLIGPAGSVGLHADRDEVGRFVKRNILHPVVIKTNLDVTRRQSCKGSGGQWLHLPSAHVVPITRVAADTGMDYGQAHDSDDLEAFEGLGSRARPTIQSQL